MKVALILTVFLLLEAPVAMALSTVTDVTPANISSQPLNFRVESEFYDDGTVRFEIFVSSGKSEISPSRDGRFVVWRGHVSARPGPIHETSSRPPMMAVCSVREEIHNGVLRYEVQANRELLGSVTFTFQNYELNGMPAFDAYEMILGEFAVEKD